MAALVNINEATTNLEQNLTSTGLRVEGIATCSLEDVVGALDPHIRPELLTGAQLDKGIRYHSGIHHDDWSICQQIQTRQQQTWR